MNAGFPVWALCLALAVPAPARAAEAEPAPPAVERLADAFADAVADARGGWRGGTAALAFTAGAVPGGAPTGGELGRLARRLLASRLKVRADFDRVVLVPPGPGAEAAAWRAGAGLLVEADLRPVDDVLLLTGLATPTRVDAWTGRAGALPRALAAVVPADRAARLLARAGPGGAPGPGGLRLTPLGTLPGRAVALAMGDLDGDGRAELAALTGQAVTVWRLEDGGARVVARRPLDDRPRSLTPARDPAGGLAVARFAAGPALAYHHSDLAEGEILALEAGGLRPLAGLAEVPVAAGGGAVLYGRWVPGTGALAPALRWVPARGAGRRLAAPGPVLEAATDGRRVGVVGSDHRFRWLLGETGAGDPGPLGAGLALADLDGDGAPERVASAARPPGPEDLLHLHGPAGAVREVRAVPGAVRALAAGDADGDGRDEVVVGTVGPEGSALWLLTGEGP